jgi:hypothetical protein
MNRPASLARNGKEHQVTARRPPDPLAFLKLKNIDSVVRPSPKTVSKHFHGSLPLRGVGASGRFFQEAEAFLSCLARTETSRPEQTTWYFSPNVCRRAELTPPAEDAETLYRESFLMYGCATFRSSRSTDISLEDTV